MGSGSGVTYWRRLRDWQAASVVGSRSMPGIPYDGHTLTEALEQADGLIKILPHH
jgi:hypothetical protein